MNKVETLTLRHLGELVPDRLRIPMTWHDIYAMTFTAPASKQYAWRLNSPYDPDYTTGISQKSAYGFTAMTQFYNRYRCFGSKIKLKILNQVAGLGYELLAAVYPSPAVITVSTDPNAKATAEKPYAKSILVGSPQGGAAEKTLVNYCSVKKLEGVSSVEFEDNFSAAFNADPTDVMYWNFMIDNLQQGSYVCNFLVDADITYYVEWYSRDNLAPA